MLSPVSQPRSTSTRLECRHCWLAARWPRYRRFGLLGRGPHHLRVCPLSRQPSSVTCYGCFGHQAAAVSSRAQVTLYPRFCRHRQWYYRTRAVAATLASTKRRPCFCGAQPRRVRRCLSRPAGGAGSSSLRKTNLTAVGVSYIVCRYDAWVWLAVMVRVGVLRAGTLRLCDCVLRVCVLYAHMYVACVGCMCAACVFCRGADDRDVAVQPI